MGSFANQNGSKGGPHEDEFWVFTNTKMNITNRVEKVVEKMRSFVKFLSFLPEFPSFNLSRKVNFLPFCADFSKKPKSVKAISIFRLKVLTTLLQKMIWFIRVWATFYEMLATKILKNMLTHQKFNKIIWFRTLTSPKTVKSLHNKQLPFSESAKRDLSDVYM